MSRLPVVLMPGFTDLFVAGYFETTRNGAWEMTFDYQDNRSSRWFGTYQWFGSSAVSFVLPCGTVTANGCEDTTFLGTLSADSVSVPWGSRMLTFVQV